MQDVMATIAKLGISAVWGAVTGPHALAATFFLCGAAVLAWTYLVVMKRRS